jgi:biopolymer transport protein ExbB
MKSKLLMLLAVTCCLVWSGVSWADEFQRVAGEVRQDLAEAGREANETRQKLTTEVADLEKQLTQTQANLEREQTLLAQGQERLAKLSQKHTSLEKRLEGSQAQMEEMAGLVRGAARNLLALAERSPYTAENPDRLEVLRSYLDKSRFPGLDDLQRVVGQYMAEIAASGGIIKRQGQLVDRAGQERQATLMRMGAFNTIYLLGQEVGYARLGPGTGRLLAVGGELPWSVASNLEAYLSGKTSAAYLDISAGGALSRLTQRTSWWDQILAGGPLIWPILAVGLVAFILVIERLIFLGRVHANTDTLMDAVNRQVAEGDLTGAWQTAETQAGRPTSNVIKAGLRLEGCQPEVIKSGLAEGMLKEMPRLERFLSVLKVLAAVAPLLGLLGTVSGMINTFHVITAHGTGDPRLMAGGISEALVTTELGLAVAIPILIFSSLLGRSAQHVVTDMEEKAVALTAALIKAGGPA